MKFTHHLLTACAAAVLCSPSFANTVTYSFSGSIDVNQSDLDFTRFSGQFSFDSSAPDLVWDDPDSGSFDMSGGLYGMSVTLDTPSYTVLTTTAKRYSMSTHIALQGPIGSPPDIGWMGVHGYVAGSGDTRFLSLRLERPLSSDALYFPPGGFTLADFDKALFIYSGLDVIAGQPGNSAYGQLDSLSCLSGCVGPVPEPETYALMLAGLGSLGALMRRRKAAQP